MESRGFPPLIGECANVLVLGTLPGQASLRAGEYYAHPRNVFWRIAADLFGISPDAPYAERIERLAAAGVALWDVCEAAHRPGSLDTAIRTGSVLPNDIEGLLTKHRAIRLVCFNGAKSRQLYARCVEPKLPPALRSIRCETLPSTNPANASTPYAAKLAQWAIVKDCIESARAT